MRVLIDNFEHRCGAVTYMINLLTIWGQATYINVTLVRKTDADFKGQT